MNNQPSLKSIFFTNYLVHLCTIASIVIFGLELYLLWVNEGNLDIFELMMIFIIIFLVLIVVIYNRISLIRSVFSDGNMTNGIITRKIGYNGQYWVALTFIYHGQTYKCTNSVVQSRTTKELTCGENVVLMVDQHNPRRAFIRDIYLQS